MPQYEYFCPTCKREVTIPMSIGAHDRGDIACPTCGGKNLESRVSSFFCTTSRKS